MFISVTVNSFHQCILSFWIKYIRAEMPGQEYTRVFLLTRIKVLVQGRNTQQGYLCTRTFGTPERKYTNLHLLPDTQIYRPECFHCVIPISDLHLNFDFAHSLYQYLIHAKKDKFLVNS